MNMAMSSMNGKILASKVDKSLLNFGEQKTEFNYLNKITF